MQENCNNCFGSKKCSMTLRQAKTGKMSGQNVTATFNHISQNDIQYKFFRKYQQHKKKYIHIYLCKKSDLNLFIKNAIVNEL